MDETLQNSRTAAVTTDAAVQLPDYEQEIVKIITSNLSPKVLREKIFDYHDNDIAAALELLSRDDRLRLYNLLDGESLSNIFAYCEDVGTYFSELSIRKKMDVLSHSEADKAVDYLRSLPKSERSGLIDLMDDDDRKEITLIGSFDEDEIGSRMTTNCIRIKTGLTVRQAMRALVDQAAEHDNISTLYVEDADDRTFYGAIDLKDLIIAREGTDLEQLIVTSYPYVYATEQIDDCIERIKEYSEDSIPVLGSDNRMLGVIASTDVVEIVDDELGDDYAKLAGLTAEEDLQEPVSKSMGKRLPWLVILLGLSLIVSTVVGLFEQVVQHLSLIVCFQSLVLNMAGNVGTQSLAVTIRVLMDEQLTGKQKLRLVCKEARVGFRNGVVLGTLSFGVIGVYILLFKGQTAQLSFTVSACTGIALMVAMLLSSISGTCIPLLFKKMGVDPAVASGPLITTLNDLVAVVAYYGLAWVLLINILHM